MVAPSITDTVEPWNYEATRDAIRHYAHGIGDDNPITVDRKAERMLQTRDIERAYDIMLARRERGEAPESFSLAP